MKVIWKRIASLSLALCLLLCGAVLAEAASGAVTVSNLITGEVLYNGNDLQEAFAKAERGCSVSIGRNITVKESVILDAEIMLSGFSRVKGWSRDVQIKLTGHGAIYTDTKIRTSYISALYSYSTVEMTEENGGYIYYLVSQAPSLEGKVPVVSTSQDVYGSRVDAEAGVIYVDGAADGITTDALAQVVTMEAENAEGVDATFQNTVTVNGKTCVTNGTLMVLTAANYDYETKISKSYRLIVVGDLNGNGRTDSADASMIMRHVSGVQELTGDALLVADVDCDGHITEADAYRICKKYVRGGSYSSAL